MTIRFEEKTKTYTVFHSKRHPVTKKSVGARRVKIKTKAEARRVERELIVQIHEKIKETVIPRWKTFLNSFSEFLLNSDISVKTAESYIYCLRAHTLDDWGNRMIDTITSNEIRTLIQEKVGDRSPSHQKNVLKYIRSAFNHACEKGFISRNPTPKMKFRIGDKIKNVLTEEQVRQLLTQAKLVDSRWYPIWCMALYTGMRNGELYALTWDKVNLETRKAKVDSSWNSKDGFKDTKSGDDRIVELAPNLVAILKELKLRNLNPPFVLPRIDKWDKGRQADDLRMFLEGMGLPRIRFHDLRATWATLMLGKGIAPIKVMSMGGWKDLKTMQFYIRKAGVNINGISNCLDLHNPVTSDNLLSIM